MAIHLAELLLYGLFCFSLHVSLGCMTTAPFFLVNLAFFLHGVTSISS